MNLDKILNEHRKWITNDSGKRADLQGADLQEANFFRADLQGANLKGVFLKRNLTIKTNRYKSYLSSYPCHFFTGIIKIGCSAFTIEEWENFNEKKITELGGRKALQFWREEKHILQAIAKSLN